MLNVLFLIGGLLLILFGANWLTEGASSLAKQLAIPPIVIGLTVVAFGTSAPELTVSVVSALKGSADMAIGNVVGSNIFNTLLIVGCTALVSPIVINNSTLRREIPFSILASVVLLLLICDQEINGAISNTLSRSDGLILLCFFTIFLSYTFSIAMKNRDMDTPKEVEQVNSMPWWKIAISILGGLAGLIIGGQLFVDGASVIARNLGVSESLIGLTLVAGGTSLPELATSIVAALKKNPEIAIGNVIGSNLFNIFFVLGTSATITPLRVAGIQSLDLWVLVISSVLLFVVGLCFGKRVIKRWEGAGLVFLYLAYTGFLIYSA